MNDPIDRQAAIDALTVSGISIRHSREASLYTPQFRQRLKKPGGANWVDATGAERRTDEPDDSFE